MGDPWVDMILHLDAVKSVGRRLVAATVIFACALIDWPAPWPADAVQFPRVFQLSDGTGVEVAESGAITLQSGGHDIFATSPLGAPTVRRFQDQPIGFAGQWVFRRANEEVFPLAERRGVTIRRSRDEVRVRFRSDLRAPGSRPRRDRAILTVRPHVPGESTLLELDVRRRRGDDPVTSIALPVRCDPNGTFYGFGEQYNGTDQRGEAFPLFVTEQGIGRVPGQPIVPINGSRHTTYFPMPYYLDARGFGVLVRTDRRVEVDLCASDPDIAWLEVVDDEPLQLLVLHGPTPLDVIRRLGDEIGRPQAPPSWAYQLWIGAQGGQDAILAEANLLRSEDIPAGVLWVQDWTGPKPGLLGGSDLHYRWEVDPDHYPDLPGLIAQVGALGFRWLGYANPFVDVNLQHFAPMSQQGLLILNPQGEPYTFFGPNATSALPDLSNPMAREFVKDFLRKMVTDFVMDGWMSDFGEWTPLDAVYADGSDPVAFHNRYPTEWHRLWREVMDELRPDGDFVIFARAGWTGVHDISMIYWVGDQQTDWSVYDGLPTVVPAMLNLGLSGIPFVTHDIAGYHSFQVPFSTKELFMRWTELGAFTPIMRTHEGLYRDDNWS